MIHDRVLELLREGANRAFSDLLAWKVEEGGLVSADQVTQETPFEIAGLVPVASPKLQGQVSLLFPREVYLALVEALYGERVEKITDERTGGAAEFANMIFGHFKGVLNGEGWEIQMAFPKVIQGKDLEDFIKSIRFNLAFLEVPSGKVFVQWEPHTEK